MLPLTADLVTDISEWKPRRGAFVGVRLEVTWFAAASFLCGVTTPIVIGIVGELYVGELLLIQLAFLMLLLNGTKSLPESRVFIFFLQLAVVMLLGYLLADIYRDARPAQFLRGWARIILLSLDIAALAIIAANDKRNLWWFALGMALGGLCDLAFREIPVYTTSGWKLGYGMSFAVLMGCASCVLPIRIAALGFALLGVGNILMDYRILGAICIILAALIWLRSSRVNRLSGMLVWQLVLACLVAGGLIIGALTATQDDYAVRRQESNVGRGAALSVAAMAIAESPLIGYGSWPMDARLVNLYYNKVDEQMGKLERPRVRTNVFLAHSQILQGWVEGGVLGVLFWFFYGYWLIRAGCYVAVRRPVDAFVPVFLFFLVYDLWHLMMSPFGGASRFMIAIGVAIICVCAGENRTTRASL